MLLYIWPEIEGSLNAVLGLAVSLRPGGCRVGPWPLGLSSTKPWVFPVYPCGPRVGRRAPFSGHASAGSSPSHHEPLPYRTIKVEVYDWDQTAGKLAEGQQVSREGAAPGQRAGLARCAQPPTHGSSGGEGPGFSSSLPSSAEVLQKASVLQDMAQGE